MLIIFFPIAIFCSFNSLNLIFYCAFLSTF